METKTKIALIEWASLESQEQEFYRLSVDEILSRATCDDIANYNMIDGGTSLREELDNGDQVLVSRDLNLS